VVQQSLGQFIRSRRLELGLTQEQLAARVGEHVAQAEISRLERDKVALPRRPRMEHLAFALEIPLGILLARSGWTAADDIPASALENAASNAELKASIDELQANNDHLRASLLDLLRENAVLMGLSVDPEPPDLVEEGTWRRLRSVLKTVDDGAVVVNHQGGVVLRNDAYVAIFAGDPQMVDTAGNPFPDDATPLQRAARRERFSMAFGLTGFGSTVWYWAEGKPMATDDGVPLGVITIRRMSGPR
jgi:transcriptional regulator with XRE-family HTH domain